MLKQCRKEFDALGNEEFALRVASFFKTGPGEYGEGDKFLGIRMPVIRQHAKKYQELDRKSLESLIESAWHEERMLGLIILLNQYEKTKKNDERGATALYKFYVRKKKFINNWDLVDVTCPRVVGAELLDKDRSILYKWVGSRDLWTRRLSIVSTMTFIRKGDFKDALKISELLLEDQHDLMHKACGWMLREVGKKDKQVLDKFLRRYQKKMPRTMLRYAIEKHPESQRKKLLVGTF